MTDNVVPFGKYKGQPIEVMLADRAYTEWCLAQPGIRERYPTFVTIVVNGGRAPDAPTPQHNRMQLLFRDPAMRVAAYRSLVKDPIFKDVDKVIRNASVEFETDGWDVVIGQSAWRLAIELKPQMGDDYPAVLRTMKRRKVDGGACALILDYFEAEGATLDDVKWLFAQSQIVVRTLDEIKAEQTAFVVREAFLSFVEEARNGGLDPFVMGVGALSLDCRLANVYVFLEESADNDSPFVELAVLPCELQPPAVVALIEKTKEDVIRAVEASQALGCASCRLVVTQVSEGIGVGFVARVRSAPPSAPPEVVDVLERARRDFVREFAAVPEVVQYIAQVRG